MTLRRCAYQEANVSIHHLYTVPRVYDCTDWRDGHFNACLIITVVIVVTERLRAIFLRLKTSARFLLVLARAGVLEDVHDFVGRR